MKKEMSPQQKRKWISTLCKEQYGPAILDSEGYNIRRVDYCVTNSFLTTKLVDADFYENPNLTQQFSSNNSQSSGSAVLDTIGDVLKERETEKAIEKADKETFGRLVLFADKHKNKQLMLDFLFFNRSFIRPMDDFHIQVRIGKGVKGINKSFNDIVWSKSYASGGKNSFFNEVTVAISVEDALLMASNEIQISVWFDNCIIEFEKKFNKVDILGLNFLKNGEKWSDSEIEDTYPLFLDNKYKTNIKNWDFFNAEQLQLLVTSPMNIEVLSEYDEYCKTVDKKSSIIDFFKSIPNLAEINEISTELTQLRKRIKKGPIVINFIFFLLLLLATAICFVVGIEYDYETDVTPYVMCVANCVIPYYLAKSWIGRLSDMKLGLMVIICVVAHVVCFFIFIGKYDSGFGVWGSYIYLVLGLILAFIFGKKYSQTNFGPATAELINKIKSKIDAME